MQRQLLICLTALTLTGCDQWTSTYIENKTNFPIIVEFTYDSSGIAVDTTKIEYRIHHNMDSLIITNCCLFVRLTDKVHHPELGTGGVLCNSGFNVNKKTWENIDYVIDSARFNFQSKYCATLDTLPNNRLRMNLTIAPGDKMEIGYGLGGSPKSAFEELHIKWNDFGNFSNRIDLFGFDAIARMAKKRSNYYVISIE